MPWIAFVDEELFEELKKLGSGNEEEDKFPEHSFIGMCLRANLTINDLKEMTYVDVMKILLSWILPRPEEEKGYRKATQADWDRLM